MKSYEKSSIELSGAPYVPLHTADPNWHLNLQQRKLKNRSETEIKMLQEKFNLPVEQLEGLLAKHPWMFKWNKLKYTLGRWTNASFPFFAGPNSYIGIQETARFFTGMSVPYDVAYPVGMAVSGLSAAYYVSAINPEALAIRFTIEYAKRDPLSKRFGDFCTCAWAQPGQTIFTLAKYTMNQAALRSTNLLGAATNFIGISSLLATLHPAIWWAGLTSFLYFGESYYDGFSNDEFWDNVNNWWDKKRPWLVCEIKNNPALVLQILIEGISTILLRTLGNYSTAKSAEKEFGFWLPSAMVLAFSFYTYLMQFYINTYDHYLQSKADVESELSKALDAPNVSDVQKRMKEREEKVQRENGYGFPIKKEPGLLFPLAYHSYIGAYLGATWGVGPAIAGAALFFTFTYRVGRARIVYKLAAQEYAEEKVSEGEVSVSQKCRKIAAIGLADTVSYGCAIANATSGIGLGNKIVNSPAQMAAYVIGTIGATINGLRFGIGKARATVCDMFGVSQTPKLSTAKAGLFHRVENHDVDEEKKPERKSICSWFR